MPGCPMADEQRAQDLRKRRILARIGALNRHTEQRIEPEPEADAVRAELETLRARVDHLESQLVGLQDSVHRENVRHRAEIQRLEAAIDPAEMSRSIEADARKRGL
jgi:hypothetical protein